MKKRALLAAAAAAWLATSALAPVAAQSWPDRPIKVIVPFAAGNVLDTALRQVGEEMKKTNGQNIIIDNKPGGAGIIAVQALMQAPPDGYTLLLNNTSMLTINPFTFSKLPYDNEKSFKHVTGFLGSSLVLAVNAASVPANNLKEFIAWAKPQGAGVSYASFTAGNSSHFAGVILNQRAGLNMVHVPFNGTPPAVQNLVGGQVHAAFLPLTAVRPHVESGKVKVLAVSTPKRSPLMPAVPTFVEEGFADMNIYIWSGLSAPLGTPDAVVQRVQAEFAKALKTQAIIDKWRETDSEPLPFSTPDFINFVRADAKRWSEAVRISGFKASE
ncbi:MAG: tripartite tricarboxylate transporter substrate binding protein [Ramlibacter sp.]|jgi:tripartite-type tricarboxylate transporter receptor subunit TctC|uniref:Bug family tripartite tricarboxylate transporter substrate binding protein n=1 Tax=Ramlibacter sp. TaxID=1917967 RepID=UPI002616B923|nr:tripartite tricarboxylate transporter substrate binding protein [Ramlibacter sp.]MDH4377327.1 tripartite tricarboxylate transporter substrate binding protein [Ramlibacter sp.]